MIANYFKINNLDEMTSVGSAVFVNHSKLLIPGWMSSLVSKPRLIFCMLTEKEKHLWEEKPRYCLNGSQCCSKLPFPQSLSLRAGLIFVAFVRPGRSLQGEQSWFNFGLAVLYPCFVLFISVFYSLMKSRIK